MSDTFKTGKMYAEVSNLAKALKGTNILDTWWITDFVHKLPHVLFSIEMSDKAKERSGSSSDLKYALVKYLRDIDIKHLSATDIIHEILCAIEAEGYQIIKVMENNKEG